jgi:hypothetical protein
MPASSSEIDTPRPLLALVCSYALDAVGYLPHTVLVEYFVHGLGKPLSIGDVFWELFGAGAIERLASIVYLIPTTLLIDLVLGKIMLIIIGFYLELGTLMEAMSMVITTIPLLFPVVTALGYDPIWFGVAMTMLVEIVMISRPDGTVLYVIEPGVIRPRPLPSLPAVDGSPASAWGATRVLTA